MKSAYENEDVLTNAMLRDVRGVTHKILTSANYKDQLVLDVRSFMPGLYLVDLLYQGQRMATIKLIVER